MIPRRGSLSGCFVTGTDTGVGKTLVASALLRAARTRVAPVAGMKPVATGCQSTSAGMRSDDALALIAAARQTLPYELANPYAFAPPIAPEFAAARCGTGIALDRIVAAHARLTGEARFAVIEGIGGWRVPLGDGLTMVDVARALDYPVVLVVGLRLGCINHALLTADAVVGDGLRLAGWIANAVEAHYTMAAETISVLTRRIRAPLLASVPALIAAAPEAADADLTAAVDVLLQQPHASA